jgi:hypothetical protein
MKKLRSDASLLRRKRELTNAVKFLEALAYDMCGAHENHEELRKQVREKAKLLREHVKVAWVYPTR